MESNNQRSSQEAHGNWRSCRDQQLRWENLLTGELLVMHSTNLAIMEVVRSKLLLKETYKKYHLLFDTSHVRNKQTHCKRCSDQMGPKLNYLFGVKLTLLINRNTPFSQ
ncbi:hypothetical protein ILYODFUR_014034 [Ilyodon furcidens]|uniref:Uncharacterized protein n=1 Tax=Ilyodon furcidens TaxID=33524 RepID=A0ABV0T989_9TELE